MEAQKNVFILSRSTVNLNVEQILKQMRLHGDTRRFSTVVHELIEIVTPVARPKALYKICCVNSQNPDFIEIDGVKFTGRLVMDNLAQAKRVFVCVATCGTEVEAVEIHAGDVIKRYCLDAIKLRLVISASDYLQEHLAHQYATGTLSSLNPGELSAFPVNQLRNLFSILGDVEGMIGVRLTKNCALIPAKSRAGIFFRSDTGFLSCRLCQHPRCQERKALYCSELALQYESFP